MTIFISVANNSRLPMPWLQLIESVPVELREGSVINEVISLGGKRTKKRSYRVKAMRRGYYRLGPLWMTTGDLFGFRQSRALLDSEFFTVYPKIIRLHRLNIESRLPFGSMASNQRLFEDPARPIGVRDYLVGDSLRHINWKVSAHSNRLFVKTFEPAISLETQIFLNLNSDEYSRRFRIDGPEWGIVVAASLASYLANRRQPVGLATNGADPLLQSAEKKGDDNNFDEESGRLQLSNNRANANTETADVNGRSQFIPSPLPARTGRAHLMKILEQLARIEAAETISFTKWIPRSSMYLDWGVTILAITPTAGESICQSLHRLVRLGYNPLLIIIEPYTNFLEIKERARYLGFQAYRVTNSRELKQLVRPASTFEATNYLSK